MVKKSESASKTAKKSTKKVTKTVKKSAKNAQKATKKRTNKKTRSDSIDAQVDVAQSAFREIEPPDNIKLYVAELVFFDSIINEFAKLEWTDHTLELAAMLAREMYALDKSQRKMQREGEILERKQVIPAKDDKPAEVVVLSTYANPRKGFIDGYWKTIASVRRSLSLHARGKGGEARDQGKRKKAAKDLEDKVKDFKDDGLIARPAITH